MPVGGHATVSLALLDLVYARQLALFGMCGLDASGFGELLDICDEGRFDPMRLIGERIALSDGGGALRQMDGGQPPGITVIDRFVE